MNKSFLGLVALSLGSLFLGGSAARADAVSWSYIWTPSKPNVYADKTTTSYVTMSPAAGTVLGPSDVVVSNLNVVSNADPNTPATLAHAGYGVTLLLVDSASHQFGPLDFSGEFNGSISSQSSLFGNTFLDGGPKTLTLGGRTYTVQLTSFTPPGPPGASNQGSISATVTVSPEPSTLALAGLGMALTGVASWRRRRQALAG